MRIAAVMVLGINPKNDFAFKCVFGSERHTAILVDVLNAVLRPPPGKRVVSVEILNPMTEPVVLDEKLSILDVRARDQSGRQFNVEMQMVPHPSLPERFLYYWAKLYSGQLVVGDRYEQLQGVISICFLDGILFPDDERYHLCFQLLEQDTKLCFTEHLELHLFQLSNFVKTADELADPLDSWLYFLNNGSGLDPDHLPATLCRSEIEEAVEVLEMLTQDEMQRAMYEDREKARRDAASWQSTLERWKQEADHLKQKADHLKQEADHLKQEADHLKQEADHAKRQAVANRTRGELIGRIRTYEQILAQEPMPEEKLEAMSFDELNALLAGLRDQYQHNGHS